MSFNGYGAKLQVFPFAAQRGLFVGVDAAYARVLVERRGTDMAERDGQLQTGINAGFRFVAFDNFYASAWLDVTHVRSACAT